MEREQELNKLINVLRRIARLATRAQWMSAGESEARYGVSQFNKILARLGELDPNIKNVFEPLAEDSSLLSVAMASGHVVSYYEDAAQAPESDSNWKVNEELGAGWFATDLGKKGFLRILAGSKPGGFNFEELDKLDNWVRDLEREWDRKRRAEHMDS